MMWLWWALVLLFGLYGWLCAYVWWSEAERLKAALAEARLATLDPPEPPPVDLAGMILMARLSGVLQDDVPLA